MIPNKKMVEITGLYGHIWFKDRRSRQSLMNIALLTMFIIFATILSPLNGLTSSKLEFSSDDFFQSAGELFKQNKRASTKQFQLFIELYPKDRLVPEAEFMVGECFFSLDPTSSEALKKFQSVVNRYSSSKQAESASLRIAEIYYNRKDYSKALDSLEKAETRYTKGYLQYERLLLKAQCYIILQRFEEAEKILTNLVSERRAYEQDKRFNYIFGLVNYQLGKDDLALRNLEEVDLPEALLFSSKSLVRLKKPLLGIEKLKDLINKYPETSLQERVNYLIGEAFFAAKDYISAIHSYERFLHFYSQSSLIGPAIYKIACSYLEKGDYLQARSSFQSFLQTEPKSEFAPRAIYLIGESFLREERFKEACFAYGDMVSSYPNDFYSANAQFKLGWCYFNLKGFQQAKSSLIKFKQLYPGHPLLPEVELLLGNTLTELKLYMAASDAYQRVIDQTKEVEIREVALALMSRANYLGENYTALVSGYRYLLNQFSPSKSPWRLITYLYLAEGYLKQGMHNEAIELYKLIQSIYPTNPLLIYAQEGLAWANFLNEDYSEAQKIREKIQNISQQKDLPEDLVLINRYELANAFFNQKKYLKAIDIFDVFHKQNPKHYLAAKAALNGGLCYYQLEYFAQAIEAWENMEKNYPDAPETKQALWKVADTYFRAQLYDKAIKTYKRIIEHYVKDNKESARAHLCIAQCYYNSKNNVLAIQSLKELIEKFPLEPQAYEALDFLTGLLEVPDSKESALSALKDIIKSLGRSNPLAIEAQFRLARSFFEDKNYSEATEMLERIISELLESTRFADSNYYLAESYYQLSEFNKAELAYKRFIDNFPEDKRAIIAIFHLGSAQFKGEKFAEAAETFEKLVQNYPDCEYSTGAMYNTILAYRKLRKWEKAASTLQMYQEKYPAAAKSSGMDIELATIYEEQNQYLKAIEILQAIRNKTDRRTETWGKITFRIAENYMTIEEEEKGIDEYQKLVSTSNPLPGGWMLNAMIKMGEYYEKNGEMQKALSLYEKIYKKSEGMAKKPAWFKAIKSRIDAIRAEIKSQ